MVVAMDKLLLLLTLALCGCSTLARPDFDQAFTGKCMQVGYNHANRKGGSGEIGFEHVVISGDWPGSRTQLIDPNDFGKYRVEMRDLASQRLLYSRGFASIFGEWETTAEAKEVLKAFEETVRLPEPRLPFRLAIQKRADDGSFQDLATRDVDLAVDRPWRRDPEQLGETVPIFVHGDNATHVDLLIVSDGYTREQRDKFVADTRRLVEVMFTTEPFQRRKSDFNVRALFVPSKEAGIANPRKEVARKSALGLSYNAFGSDRYVLTMDDFALRQTCAQAPYDTLILLFNERKYGGGGIYNLWATVAADTEPAAYVFVHEFGHSFAGLADEYYSSQVAYEEFIKPGVEPWEPNVTALLDPANLKWKDLVAKDTPLPTPWGQQHFDEIDLAYQARRAQMLEAKASEEAMEGLFREVKGSTAPLLARERYANAVGAFEGASYQAKGLFRPEVDCIMFTRNPTRFCAVCERAIERVIDSYAR